tara:strand:- start:1492 stop:1725 length:234 start_codon:yes stop_codon:yes gene_type:complete
MPNKPKSTISGYNNGGNVRPPFISYKGTLRTPRITDAEKARIKAGLAGDKAREKQFNFDMRELGMKPDIKPPKRRKK